MWQRRSSHDGLANVRRALRRPRGGAEESDEPYLLSPRRRGVGERDELLDVKRASWPLDARGLEQWRPVAKGLFPAPRDGVGGAVARLRVVAPPLAREAGTVLGPPPRRGSCRRSTRCWPSRRIIDARATPSGASWPRSARSARTRAPRARSRLSARPACVMTPSAPSTSRRARTVSRPRGCPRSAPGPTRPTAAGRADRPGHGGQCQRRPRSARRLLCRWRGRVPATEPCDDRDLRGQAEHAGHHDDRAGDPVSAGQHDGPEDERGRQPHSQERRPHSRRLKFSLAVTMRLLSEVP